MPNENTITISVERFQQLIRAEQDANQMKTLLADKVENYGNFSRDEMKLLYTMYCNKKEETEE